MYVIEQRREINTHHESNYQKNIKALKRSAQDSLMFCTFQMASQRACFWNKNFRYKTHFIHIERE